MGLGGLGEEDQHEPRSTPKLSLSRLPCKPKLPIHMLTPPLHPSLSVPFQWEEAPGRPRFSADDADRTCSLDLPPRLLLQELTIMPSPPTLFYASLFQCCTCTFSFRRFTGCFKERPTFGISQTLGDFFMTDENKNKMGKFTRVPSLFRFSAINSNMLDIYASFKQAIPWRRRRR